MPTLRPAVKEDDEYIQKVIKYIPAEVVAGYTAIAGILSIDTSLPIPEGYKKWYLIFLCVLLIAAVVWTYYAVIDNVPTGTPPDKKRAAFHSVIAGAAFLIWAYAIGHPLLEANMCCCEGFFLTANAVITKTCGCVIYNPKAGSILLILFTICTPLLERIVLGKK